MGNIIEQILLLFMFMVSGYMLVKCKITDSGHTKILSSILVYLFLPSTVFKAFCNNFKIESFYEHYPLVVASCIILGVLIAVAGVISRGLTKDEYERNVYKYSLIIPNYGYMGYALAEGIYGSEGLLEMVIFAIPFTIFTYTFGFCMLSGKKVSLKRIVNPVTIALIAGALFGILNIPLPGVFESFLKKSSGCMGPVSMLLAGMTMAEFPVKELIVNKTVFLVSLIRLFAIPLCLFFALSGFCDKEIVRTAVLLCAMPCGLNTIVFPKLVGKNCMTGAGLAFVSNIIAIVSVPVVLGLL